MGWQAWFTVAVVLSTVAFLALSRLAPDFILLGAVTLLVTVGILEPQKALDGLANEGTLTVAVLFVVAAGLRETGGMGLIVQHILGRPGSLFTALARLLFPTAFLSAFMDNTPLVAMLLPGVRDWAKKNNFSPSKLLIPLSYATILGGTCTLIGTSTNLVVNGLLTALKDPHYPSLSLFDIAPVGIPCAIVGLLYVLFFSRSLLPDRLPAMSALADPREYSVEMLVEPGSLLAGQTIEQAGLRHLPGMYLMEIERSGQVLAAVSPEERLQGGDRLVFVGVVESVVDLQKIRGLKPATDQVFKLDAPRSQRCLIEAVVSDSCPGIGMTIRDGRFRTNYNAVVIAVARNGERVRKKIGDIVLCAGDTLLLEAHPSFVQEQRNSRDFYLVSRVADSTPPSHERAWLAMAILLGMVISAGTGWLSMLNAAMLAAGLMVITRCTTWAVARRSVDWSLLLVIAAAFGLGKALETTRAAEVIAGGLIGAAGNNPWIALAAVYGVTMVFTEVITNNAAAALVFPIALATAKSLDVNFMPFVIAVMMAASASFSTPIGYQTNLMVYGPGGYRFSDYFRIGIPLNLLLWGVTVLLAPFIWPFAS